MEIRPCRNIEEVRDAAGAITHYFGKDRPTEEWAERWLKNFELARMHAALDGDRIVGGAGAFTFRMTVPGGAAVPCAGVTVIGVLPTHRRRGFLRAMMRAQLDDIHERGEPIAALWASEETIYGRYGYGLASLNLGVEIDKTMSAFHPGAATVGSVRLVDIEEAARLLPPVYDAVRVETPGMYERPPSWWETRTLIDSPEMSSGSPKHLAVLEVDGEPQGYAIYRMNVTFGNLGPETTVRVVEAMGVTPEATISIWRFLLDIDWTKTVASHLVPVDHPLFLLLERPNQAKPTMSDGLWIRLVDVGAALSGRAYAGDDPVVLDVRDAFCPWNEGRWKLAGGTASRTNDAPDLALDVGDLGSVYLGGFTFRELRRAGRVAELTQGALDRADAVFRTAGAPWCPEIF